MRRNLDIFLKTNVSNVRFPPIREIQTRSAFGPLLLLAGGVVVGGELEPNQNIHLMSQPGHTYKNRMFACGPKWTRLEGG
jgi:hypothetical protein